MQGRSSGLGGPGGRDRERGGGRGGGKGSVGECTHAFIRASTFTHVNGDAHTLHHCIESRRGRNSGTSACFTVSLVLLRYKHDESHHTGPVGEGVG